MILIISSWSDGQVERIRQALGEDRRVVVLNPHALCQRPDEFGLCLSSDGSVRVVTDAYEGIPSYVYWNSRPRADAAIVPTHVRHPSAYRSRLTQFVWDIAHVFETIRQSPGSLSDIERAESKIWLLRKAIDVGLTIPDFTQNLVGKRTVSSQAERTGAVYRKVLGPPCTVSESGTGITTTNVAIEATDTAMLEAGASQPWQYQAIIPFVAQIRCFIAGDRIWSARWEHRPEGREWDMRYVQEVQGRRIPFKPVELPQATQAKLVALTKNCGLNRSAPELLELADGSYVFIDLNPCGDWLSVFPESAEREITNVIAAMIRS